MHLVWPVQIAHNRHQPSSYQARSQGEWRGVYLHPPLELMIFIPNPAKAVQLLHCWLLMQGLNFFFHRGLLEIQNRKTYRNLKQKKLLLWWWCISLHFGLATLFGWRERLSLWLGTWRGPLDLYKPLLLALYSTRNKQLLVKYSKKCSIVNTCTCNSFNSFTQAEALLPS